MSSNPLRNLSQTKASQKPTSTTQPVSIQSRHNSQEDDYDWRDDAACRGRTSEFFPKEGSHKSLEHIGPARKICASCPVLEQCREWVLESFPPTDLHGIWAGLSPRQVASEQQRLGITPKYLTIAQVWADFERLARKSGRDLYERWDDEDEFEEEIESYPDDDLDIIG